MTDGQEIPSVVEETNSVLSAQALVCNICGENHETEDCTLLQNAKPMPDTQAVSRARLTLPSSLELRTLADGSTTVVAKVIVESGTLFGPFEAQLSVDMHPGVYFPLKIFGKTACEGYYLDTTDEETCNWMCLVAPATTNKEQNLMCYDMKESIYYSVTRDVLPGEELKVWYALYYGFKLQALPLTDDTSEDGFWDFVQETPVPKSNHSSGGLIFGQELVETLAQHLPAQTLGAKRERDTWKCRLCNVQETNVASYARHLMAHYHRPVSSSDTSSCPVCHTHLFPMKSVVKQNECKCQNRTQQLSEQVVNGSSSITVSYYFKSNEPSTNKSSGDSTHISEESNTARMSDDQRLSPILEQWKQQQQQQQRQQHQQQRQQRRQKQQRQKRQREQWQRKRSKWQQRLKDRNQEADLTVHQNKLQQAEDTENGAIVSCSNVDGHGGSTGKLMSLASISSLELHNINLGCENATLYDVTDSDSATSLKVLRSKLDPDSQADDDESTDKLVKVKRGESLPGTMDANNITYQEVRGEISTNSMVLSEIMPNVFNDNIVKDYPQEENNSDGNQTQSSEYSVVSRTQLILQTEDGASIPTTFHFDGSQSINVALDNGEPVTFILVNSPNDEQFPVDGDNLHCPDTVGELNIKMNCDESKTVEDLKVLSNNRDGSLPLDGCRSPETNASEGSCVDTASEETQSGFTCDICNKTFDKSAYLYRHLRKHTGEFTCMTCLAVFARKENLMLHSCSRRVMRYPCPSCGKKFSAKKYLQRHLPLHTGQFTCKDCHRSFVSKMSLSLHRCPAGQQEIEGSSSVTCSLCQLMFPDQVKLQAHLKHHSDVSPDGTRGYLTSTMVTRKTKKHHQRFNKHSDVKSGDENTSSTDKDYVCEICGAGFKSASSMKTHSFLHGERRFECEVCNKRFHRKDVLQDHLTVHQTAKLPCLICGKKYKTKKSLDVHIMTHGGTKRFSCEECGKEFFQKGNLLKHQQTHTPSTERTFTCEHCNKTFTSKEYFNVHTLEHTQGKIFSCEKCNKSFVKKHFLESHRQLYHSNRVFLCPFCNSFMRHRHSARRHLEQRHDANRSEWSTKGFIDRMLAHLPDKSLTAPSDGSLTSGHQQQRQQMLFNLRRQHFGDNFVPHTGSTVAEDQSTDYLYTILPNSDTQLTLNQGDQHSASQPVKQLTLLDNFLLGSLSCEVPSACSADLQENEILLTVVGTNACKDQQNASISASVEGNTYVLEEDSGGTEGVLLYVLESADVGDTQDLFWDSGQGEASCAER